MPTDPLSLERAADPKYWRDRAEEARALAEHMHDPLAIETMLRAAGEYERLALTAEGLRRARFAAGARFFHAGD